MAADLSDLKNEELPKNVYIKNSMDLVFLNEEVRSERYDKFHKYEATQLFRPWTVEQ